MSINKRLKEDMKKLMEMKSERKKMSHTQGKLATNADRIESEKEHGWANDGWIIAKCEGPDAFANTRRLVACWNALEGVPTEWLENYVFRSVENVIQENAALKGQLSSLKAASDDALSWLVYMNANSTQNHTQVERARHAENNLREALNALEEK